MGGVCPSDVIWTTSVFPWIVHSRVGNLLRKKEITGWRSYPVQVVDMFIDAKVENVWFERLTEKKSALPFTKLGARIVFLPILSRRWQRLIGELGWRSREAGNEEMLNAGCERLRRELQIQT